MTTIVDYTTLQAAVIEYLGRDYDTTFVARVPTFIQLAEAKFNRGLFSRRMETTYSTALTPSTATLALPSDFQTMRRVRISAGAPSGKPYLTYITGPEMDDIRVTRADSAALPVFYNIYGSTIELCPTPDQAYTIELTYRQLLPALASNSTNWLLTLAPDAYLYGALMEAAPYMKDDDRTQLWALGLKQALDSLNDLSIKSSYSGPLQMRTIGNNP